MTHQEQNTCVERTVAALQAELALAEQREHERRVQIGTYTYTGRHRTTATR